MRAIKELEAPFEVFLLTYFPFAIKNRKSEKLFLLPDKSSCYSKALLGDHKSPKFKLIISEVLLEE